MDRWAIAHLKQVRGKIDTVEEQYAYLEYTTDAYYANDIAKYFKLLFEINGKIWSLESDIRLGKETELGLEEVGRRALQIRDHNKVRIQYKNELNLKYNEGFEEIKVNHSSE